MRITQVTASYGATQSLPSYSNVKPQFTLSAEVEPGEDALTVAAELAAQVRALVEAEIDDALEAAGEPAKYDPAPRYQVAYTSDTYVYPEGSHQRVKITSPENLVIILPNEINIETLPGKEFLNHFYNISRRIRLAHARREAAAKLTDKEGYKLLELSDGDLSKLPAFLTTPIVVPEPEPRVDINELEEDDHDEDRDDEDYDEFDEDV